MPVSLTAPEKRAVPESAVVTGATGFVGRALMASLGASGRPLSLGGEEWRRDIETAPLAGATIFHLAARVHETSSAASEDDYLRDNAEKTRVLAQAAARAGARRLVFLSTIKVNGEETRDRPFTSEDPPAPRDAYARSKLAAERHLADLAASAGLDATVVRAPLVYGAGARGNLRALLRLADTPWPLPFARLHNRRSFIHVQDLCECLLLCARVAAARGRTYLVAHREPVSTPQLVAHMRAALGRPSRLFVLPRALLETVGAAAGGERVRRLTRSLEIDPSAAERELGWTARVGLDRAVREMAAAYRAET